MHAYNLFWLFPPLPPVALFHPPPSVGSLFTNSVNFTLTMFGSRDYASVLRI